MLVDECDDLVICMIGTNNRHLLFTHIPKHPLEEHTDVFYRNILKLHERFLKNWKCVIFVTGIPASLENEKGCEGFLAPISYGGCLCTT